MNIPFHIPSPLSQSICLLLVILLTLRHVSIQDFLCICIHIHICSFVYTKMELDHMYCSTQNTTWSFHVRRSLTLSNSCIVFHNMDTPLFSHWWVFKMFPVSSCYSDARELTHLSLTGGHLSHGQPDQRQSGDRIGLGWQRYVLGPRL